MAPASPRRARLSALALAVVACCATLAQAQSSDGSLTGRAAPGASVRLVNLDTGTQWQRTVDAQGTFSFARLPPGRYRVGTGDLQQELLVEVGAGSTVDLQAGSRVSVVQSRALALIDHGSVESTSTFTQDEVRALPLARNINAVALLTPGTVKGDSFGGSLLSFSGASIAENGYFINGFDVTNIRTFMSYAELPFDAIAQQQVRSGGYGAEFGRSLGGVIGVVTQRGGNTWKGGASVYWEPQAARASGRDVADREPERQGGYTVFNSANRSDNLSFTVHGGGPLVADRLFVYGLLEQHADRSNAFLQDQSTLTRDSSHSGLLKLDWTPSDRHLLELTGIWNQQRSRLTDHTSATPYSPTHDGEGRISQARGGSDVLIGKYTGYLSDTLTVSALAGRVRALGGVTSGARVSGQDCPVVLAVDLSPLGCWTPPFQGPAVIDPAAPRDQDSRHGVRLDAEVRLGTHILRGGYDGQSFRSLAAGGSAYSGGVYYRYFVSPSGIVNGVPDATTPGGQYVRARVSKSTSGAYRVINDALYLEDSWQASRQWLLYGGLRLESFDNQNAEGESFVKARHLPAPRTGFAWRADDDGTLKVFGTAGRYFIPVASNTNIRATRGEIFTERFYTFTGSDSRTSAPTGLSSEIGATIAPSDGRLPNPGTIADTRLRPMNQDEFILGLQKAVSRQWLVGAKAVYRHINDGMDDFCGHQAIEAWAQRNGHVDFDSGTLALCVLMNPGRDLHLRADLANDGKLVEITVPAAELGLARYRRSYQALQLTLERPLADGWSLLGSYTWSRNHGTAEGYVQSDLKQTDAGLTQDFDFASFTHGAEGLLPNDRRHVFKLAGSLALSPQFNLGANLTIASGRPTSCIGFVPPTVADFAEARQYPSASSYYCLKDETNGAVLLQRGTAGTTPWTHQLDLRVAYTPDWAARQLTLQAEVFNVFNRQSATEWNQVRDFGRSTSLAAPYQLNQNYQSPTVFQAPRYVRLTARWMF